MSASEVRADYWDRRYRHGETAWDTGHPSTELVRVVQERAIAPCRAIDLGCGTGTNALWLAHRGFDVTGVDISCTAIASARERAAAAGITARFFVDDLLGSRGFGEPCGFFFDRGCYHHLREVDLPGYFRALESIAAPGATGLVIAGNANEPRSGPPVVSEEQIRAELSGPFQIVSLREIRLDSAPCDPVRSLAWSCLLYRA